MYRSLETGHVVLRLLRVVLAADAAGVAGGAGTRLIEGRAWAVRRIARRGQPQVLAGLARRAGRARRIVGQGGTGQPQREEGDDQGNQHGSAHGAPPSERWRPSRLARFPGRGKHFSVDDTEPGPVWFRGL